MAQKSVPIEIWSLIFVECLPSETFIRPSPSTAPLSLCMVSPLWRDIALQTSKLWSSMHVSYKNSWMALDSESSDGQMSPKEELVHLWLARSKNVPLSIKYEAYRAPFGEGPGFTNIVRAILENAHRWEHIVLWGHHIFRQDLDVLLPDAEGRRRIETPRLKTFSLEAESEYDWVPPCVSNIWPTSPLLLRFAIKGACDFGILHQHSDDEELGDPPENPSEPNFYKFATVQYRQLTHFILSTLIPAKDVIMLLSAIPGLAHFDIQKVADPCLQPGHIRPHIYLPNLRHLAIGGYTSENGATSEAPRGILDSITVPGLTSLALVNLGTDLEWPRNIMTAFIKRSQCSLIRISFEDVGMASRRQNSDFLDFMDLNPTVEFVHVGGQTRWDPAQRTFKEGWLQPKEFYHLRRINPSTGRFVYCPNMREFSTNSRAMS
ncbi:hypothetical protein BDZ97DRAFT_1846017, partial [Flammula alnicola]